MKDPEGDQSQGTKDCFSHQKENYKTIPPFVLALLASQQATLPECSQHSRGLRQHHNEWHQEEALVAGTKV